MAAIQKRTPLIRSQFDRAKLYSNYSGSNTNSSTHIAILHIIEVSYSSTTFSVVPRQAFMEPSVEQCTRLLRERGMDNFTSLVENSTDDAMLCTDVMPLSHHVFRSKTFACTDFVLYCTFETIHCCRPITMALSLFLNYFLLNLF